MLISSYPLTNMTVIGNYYFWLVDFEKSSPLKPHCQIKLNFTRSNYGRFSIIFPYFIPIGQKTLSPWTILVSDWLNLTKFFTCETRRHDELLLCRNDVWEVCTKFQYFVPIGEVILNWIFFMLNIHLLTDLFLLSVICSIISRLYPLDTF